MALDLSEASEGAGGGMKTTGTDSIFMAVRACREWLRDAKGLRGSLNIFAAESATRFRQGWRDDGIRVKRVPLQDDCRSDPDAMASAVDDDTMMIVGSAPCFPHGVVDEILPLSRVAESADVWLHIYVCVGGYHAPFAKSLGRDMPDFDFSFPSIRSLTAYLREFGFAQKPSSTVLYRSEEDFERQIFDLDPRTYGRMTSSTLVGVRHADGITGSWAVFKHLSRAGYTKILTDLLAMLDAYFAGIEAIPGLKMHAKPDLTIINFDSDEVDIFRVAELRAERDWVPGLPQRTCGARYDVDVASAGTRTVSARFVGCCWGGPRQKWQDSRNRRSVLRVSATCYWSPAVRRAK